eukprot:13971775-Ditylum_brightwellii.AAC.1
MNDKYSYDTVTTAFVSETPHYKNNEVHEKYSGLSTLSLPYLLDLWHDTHGRWHVSVQVHMLSGSGVYLEIT